MVVHASAQANRRQRRLERAIPAAQSTIQTAARTAAPPEDGCRAAADGAAAQLRAVHTPAHLVAVTVEERPVDGRGRPSAHTPRTGKALRSRLQTTMRPHTERRRRLEAEAGGCVLLTKVPTAGPLAQSGRESRPVSQEHQGTEPHDGFCTAPVMVKRLFLKKPARIAALGWVVWLALRRWRLRERPLRAHVERPGPPWTGWAKKPTARPPACMMMTQCAGGLVRNVGPQRQLARPLSAVQQQSLVALRVSATGFTLPAGNTVRHEFC